jgi:hypothetical protein
MIVTFLLTSLAKEPEHLPKETAQAILLDFRSFRIMVSYLP